MKRRLRVVVTGGAGMIGSHIAEHFSAQGARVVALDNLSRLRQLGYPLSRQHLAWGALRQYPNAKRLVGDIRRRSDLRSALSPGADLIVHAAGQVGVQESYRHPQSDCNINTLGTVRLLEAVRRLTPGATVIFCSTNKVYGGSVNALPIRIRATRYAWCNRRGIAEDWPVDRTPHTPYGVSKLAADLYVQEYAHSYGLRTAVFRMSCIYGERQLGMPDQGWVTWMALAILKGWPITVYGTGKQVRDLLHVQDLARLCKRYLHSACKSDVFNVGGGPKNSASVLEVLGRLAQLLGKTPRLRFAPERLHDQKIYLSNIRKAEKMLGWVPRIGVDQGLRRLTGWLKQRSDWFA